MEKLETKAKGKTQLLKNEYFYFSESGLKQVERSRDPKLPQKNIFWTTDYSIELPIIVKKSGPGSETPFTLIQLFNGAVEKYGDKVILKVRKGGKDEN